MTNRLPSSPTPSMHKLISRRNVITFVGAGVTTIVLGQSVLGKDDDKDKDEHDDHSGHDDHDEIQPSGTVPANSAEVRIDDDDADGFEPGTITIDLGESVTWVNVDDDPHTATGEGFDTGTIDPGQQATVTFDEPGSFHYSCSFHPIMTGIVEVRDENGQVPDRAVASPEASPHASPNASDQASVSINHSAFDPVELRITVGTTVVWTNHEAVPHTVTASDESFGSPTLGLDDTFSHQFTSTGTFDYFCAIHAQMDATVIVTD